MRGKPSLKGITTEQLGITPAGAGKTFVGQDNNAAGKDHPRRCGENFARRTKLSWVPGSPPQVRGKRIGRLKLQPTFRITPAGAGKTIVGCDSDFFCWDHPRRCGENDPIPDNRDGTLGSPPQVRGKRQRIILRSCRHGITPAGAGKTA